MIRVCTSLNWVWLMPRGSKIRSAAKSRSDWPVARLTMTDSRKYPVLQYRCSSPGAKLGAFWSAMMSSTSASVERSSAITPWRLISSM